jgi:hypothetical protein
VASESYAAAPPGRVVEWFRSGLRRKIAAAVVPALLCATLGWLLLMLGSALVRSRCPETALVHHPAFPAAAVVDAEGHPAMAVELLPVEQALLGGGLVTALVSPLLLVHLLSRRGRRRESELLLRTDGLSLRSGDDSIWVTWDEIEEVVHRPEQRGVALVLHDGTEVVLDARFEGVDGAELTRRIRSVRSRALFGLLAPEPWPERTARG